MFNLQGSEIIFILLLALVVLGPEKLPGAIRRFTRTYAELRKMGSSFQQEVKTAFDEPMREVRETADLIKQQVDVDALEAEQADARDAIEPAEGAADTEPVADDPFAPPVAGTARPGPDRPDLPTEPVDTDIPTPPPPRTVIPPPPAPFSTANGTHRPRPAPEPHADEVNEERGAASP